MSCSICGRSSCTSSFHSLRQQELYTEAGKYDTTRSIVELLEEIEQLKDGKVKLEAKLEKLEADLDGFIHGSL